MPEQHRHLVNKCEDIVNLQGVEAYCVATRTACLMKLLVYFADCTKSLHLLCILVFEQARRALVTNSRWRCVNQASTSRTEYQAVRAVLKVIAFDVYHFIWILLAFSDMTLLVGLHLEGHLFCKNFTTVVLKSFRRNAIEKKWCS